MNSHRIRRSTTLLAVIVVATASAACGGNESSMPASGDKGADTAATAADTTVRMRLIAFRPDALTVPVGTKVTWIQDDAGAHTVTSGTVVQGTGGVTEMPDGTFDSGSIAKGDSFAFTFDAAGTYAYFCHIHPATMRGEVRVV